MKETICLFGLILSFCTLISAQEQIVIANSGNYFSNNQGSLSSTLGETITVTLEVSDGILTNGFQQSNLIITDIIDVEENAFSFSIYPNPASEFVVIRSYKKLKEHTTVQIYNLEGSLIQQEPIQSKENKIDITTLLNATYIVRVTTNDKVVKSCKIIKIN